MKRSLAFVIDVDRVPDPSIIDIGPVQVRKYRHTAMAKRPAIRASLFLTLFLLVYMPNQRLEAYNRYAHVELFNRSVLYLEDCDLTDVYEFYTGDNPESVDVTVLADDDDEIMWVDIHSTTEPDGDAAYYLIDQAYVHCWNDSLERLKDPQDIEDCKDCIRAVVDEFSHMALPRAGQETVYFPSRGAARSRYNFCWEIPLSMIVGLVDPECDALGTRFGVSAQNSLRASIKVHSAKFKSIEYLNYAIRAWNDSDYESSLRWLVRICNYDPHHSLTAFKSYDYLTEDWVSVDMDGDSDIDYDDSEAWSRQLLDYGIYYVLFCDLADGRIPSMEPGSLDVHRTDIIESHSVLMDARASYSASRWHLVDELVDYLNGNARDAVDQFLPEIVTSTAELLASFYHNVVDTTHPEFLLLCIEGIPTDVKAPIHFELNFENRSHAGTDSVRGENFTLYEIPVSVGIRVEDCVDCDTATGYRFDQMIICDGNTSYGSLERTFVTDRATTVHLLYTPYWEQTDLLRPGADGPPRLQISSSRSVLPETFSLSQNYPNPASAKTTVEYDLAELSHVRLELFNAAAQRVLSIVDTKQPPGVKTVHIDTDGLAPGVYFLRLEAGRYRAVRKMLVIR